MASVRLQFPENETPTVLNLTGPRISVGRLPHNTIQIIDRTISALHAEFIREGDHYRLHDRGSANGTFVNGEGVTDFHLRDACRISFGAFECEFSPALAVAEPEESVENLPSRGEINDVRHENAKLRNQVELLREEVETLSKATSAETGNSEGNAVLKAELVRVIEEMEKLKETLLQSREEVKRLKNNLSVLQRDRENLQRAWDETKAELAKNRVAAAPVAARAIAPDEPAIGTGGAEIKEEAGVSNEPAEAQEASEVAAVKEKEEPAAPPPSFKPVSKPAMPPGKLFVPTKPQAAPAHGPTVTQPQPIAVNAAPAAQPGSGSGIRPFAKANPPATASKPALSGNAPIAQGTQARPVPLPPIKPMARPVAKAPVATPPRVRKARKN